MKGDFVLKSQEKPLVDHVPALEKGLDILEVLSSASEPRSLTDISRVLGRRTSELFRMLDCLEKRGYIVKEPHSGDYFLSLKLYELARTHSPIERILKAATIPMRSLTLEIRESVI
jgi:DNA-binding IclR family transcriptional regulator